MALGADAVAWPGLKAGGVHDIGGFTAGNVRGARPVASLAADAAFKERRGPVAILRPGDWLYAGCVALQAPGRDGAGQERVGIAIIAGWRSQDLA